MASIDAVNGGNQVAGQYRSHGGYGWTRPPSLEVIIAKEVADLYGGLSLDESNR